MRMALNSPVERHRGTLAEMDFDRLPPQLQGPLRGLARVVSSREPALQAKVTQLRTRHPHFTKVLSGLISESQGQRIQAALATLH